MSIAYVQSRNTNNGNVPTNVVALAYTSNNTAGNFLISAGRLALNTGSRTSGAGVGVSDTANGAWTIVFLQDADGVGGGPTKGCYFMAYRANCAGGANTVTVTITGVAPSFYFSYAIAEYSGIKTSSVLDTFAKATQVSGTNVNAATSPVTPTHPLSLIITCFGNETANSLVLTAGTGFTMREIVNGNTGFEDQIVNLIAPITPAMTYSTPVDWGGGAGVFTGVTVGKSGMPPQVI